MGRSMTPTTTTTTTTTTTRIILRVDTLLWRVVLVRGIVCLFVCLFVPLLLLFRLVVGRFTILTHLTKDRIDFMGVP